MLFFQDIDCREPGSAINWTALRLSIP